MKCQEFEKQRLHLKCGDIWWDTERNNSLSLITNAKFVEIRRGRFVIRNWGEGWRNLNIWPNSQVWRKL